MMWKANSFFLKSCCFFGVFSVMVDEKAKVLEGCKLNTDGSCAVLKTSVWLKECCACSGHNTVPSLRFNCYFLLFFGSVRVVVSLQCFPSPKIWLLFAQMLCCMSPAQLASRDPVLICSSVTNAFRLCPSSASTSDHNPAIPQGLHLWPARTHHHPLRSQREPSAQVRPTFNT